MGQRRSVLLGRRSDVPRHTAIPILERFSKVAVREVYQRGHQCANAGTDRSFNRARIESMTSDLSEMAHPMSLQLDSQQHRMLLKHQNFDIGLEIRT